MASRQATDIQQSELFQKLLRETGKIDWTALAPHYESGGLVLVSRELDLVDVAYRFAQDEKETVAGWLQNGRVAKVQPKQVERWNREKPRFWAVVVAPWVLIQAVKPPGEDSDPKGRRM